MNQQQYRRERIQYGSDTVAEYRAGRLRIQERLDELGGRVDQWLAAYESEAEETEDMVRLDALQADLAKLVTAFREIENVLIEESVNVNDIIRTPEQATG